MSVPYRPVSIFFRIFQLTFSIEIFILTLAALSLLLVLLFLIPTFTTAIHYPIDFLFCLLWVIAYALLVRFVVTLGCGSIWDWGILIEGGMCGRWTSAMAAGLLGTVFWGVGAVVIGHEGSKAADELDRDLCLCGGKGERKGE
ncbi:MAG: hypothetical protein Q9187_000265 [Circinaria calcarea]